MYEMEGPRLAGLAAAPPPPPIARLTRFRPAVPLPPKTRLSSGFPDLSRSRGLPRGGPRLCGESISTPLATAAQGVSVHHFKILLSSTGRALLSPAQPACPPAVHM